jgi:hypothetical protein
MSGCHCPNFPNCMEVSDTPRLPTCEKDDCPGRPRLASILFHTTPNEELCKDGRKHNFKGGRSIDGGRGWTTVCTECGITAMDHSLRYGP